MNAPMTVTPEAEIAQLRTDRMEGKINDAQWPAAERRIMELAGIAPQVDAYKRAQPHERAAIRAGWQAQEDDAGIARSVAESHVPSSPYNYVLEQSAHPTEADHEVEQQFRDGAYESRAPSHIARGLYAEIKRSARERFVALESDDDGEANAQLTARNKQSMRELEGPQHAATQELVDSFLRDLSVRAPKMHAFLTLDPDWLVHPGVRTYLRQWALYQRGRR
jgi:hypothetical protein